MPRFKIVIQYDGSNFYGWQMQKSERTVQGVLEDALIVFNNDRRVKVIGASRTDTGVHALGQVAHFDLNTELDDDKLIKAVNARLPEDIHVMNLMVVTQEFHARFSATTRYYRYQCYTGQTLLFRNQAWNTGPLDISCLQNVADLTVGDHDFTSFCRVGPNKDHFRCSVLKSRWKRDRNLLIYQIAANRYLHHMVRYLTGCMVAIAKGRFTVAEFKDLLYNPRKNVKVFKAPPQGLILERIDYD